MTIPPALTILPDTGSVTVTVPCPLLVVEVLAPPAAWTICVPDSVPAGIVIMPEELHANIKMLEVQVLISFKLYYFVIARQNNMQPNSIKE